MKRLIPIILALLMLAPLLPFAEISPDLKDDLTPNWSSAAPSVTLTEESFPQISLAGLNTCAILGDGTLKCWGNGASGRLGIGSSVSHNTPQIVNFGSGLTAVSVSVNQEHTCAILDGGSLNCWGTGSGGKLGHGTGDYMVSPATVNLGSGRTAVSVSPGQDHTCAILDNGAVSCWGIGSSGQLGNGATSSTAIPMLTSSLGVNRTAVAISSGYTHTCAILDNGLVSCWGNGNYGQIGNGAISGKTTPTLTSSLGANRTAVAISSGQDHTCAILDNGSVSCWGSNSYGSLGNGGNSNQNTPQTVNLGLGRTAVIVSAGFSSTCAVLDDASLTCWGYNGVGQLGIGTTTHHNTPQTVDFGLGRTVVSVNVGGAHSCAVLNDGSLTCWGSNSNGQFGDGTFQNRLEPTTNFTDVTPVW